uniref:Solute carrier family 3 member 2 n=1 Tax=Neogobius melanostomus TaxID=47308 RepID=A0A8C6T5Q5_9GOBI
IHRDTETPRHHQAEEEKALDLEEEEKTPMTAGDQGASADSEAAQGPEQNGAVKLKIPEEEEEDAVHFTGLNKEELLRVAGTPGWVRTRWSLLVLFWLSWLGMLAAAVLIILKAPPCKELPSLNWWNEGPLYGVRSIQDFSAAGNIRGVEQRLEHLQQLKVKGLVLGPVHVAPKDQPMALSFKEVSTESGSLDQMKSLLQTAHKRGIIHLLITIHIMSIHPSIHFLPLYPGRVAGQQSQLWRGPPDVSGPQRSDGRYGARSDDAAAELRPRPAQLLWSLEPLGGAGEEEACQSSDLLLLLTLPGTALIQSGDELGLRAAQVRDSGRGYETQGGATNSGRATRLRAGLSETRAGYETQGRLRDSGRGSGTRLRAGERSLMFGDFQLLFNSSSALVFLRSWDQSPRFLALTNSSPDRALSLGAEGGALERLGGATGRVVFSSNTSILALDQELQLRDVTVGPREAALLQIL